MVFVIVQIRSQCRILKNWFGCIVAEQLTLVDLYNQYASGQLDNSAAAPSEFATAMIHCSLGRSKHELVRVSSDVPVGEAVSTLGQFVDFNVTVEAQETTTASATVDAFTILLQGAKNKTSLPEKWSATNGKLRMRNDVIDWLAKNKLGWEAALAKHVGVTFVSTLADALWYIDGNGKTLTDRSLGVPAQLQQFQGYKQPEKHKHRKVVADSMRASELRNHSAALFTLAASAYMKIQRWTSIRETVLHLATNLQQYASYLDSQKDATRENQLRMEVRSDVDEITILAAKSIHPGPVARYRTLHQALQKSKPFEAVFVNDHAPPDAKRRYEYMKGLVVPCKCVRYTYTGSRNHLHFVWQTPLDSTESEILNQSLKVRDELKKSFPVYHSRAMRREFVHLFGKVTHSKPAFLREAYRRLTGDCSASSNVTEREVDERITQLLEDEDPDLIWDLRVDNEGRPEMYTTFLEFCQKYIDSQIDTAVDDRRHDAVVEGDVVTHLAAAMSVRDLHEQVTKQCPEGTPIPSIQWLRQQFWPRRTNCGFAKRQRGRLHIKFMIQARQFRKAHIDAHYASALFRYQREFAIRYREYCTMVSMDDKHVVKVGEPEYPVAGVERGKQVLVTSAKKLAVADHDFTKFSLTPSVSFLINTPEKITESFYTGRVFVGLKDNVFQPSSPIRHMTELKGVLHAINDTHPLLLLYTDGGPDHRLTYTTVQISLISLFLALDLDYLCAVRTPPYHSWKNPAERIMSILNVGLQSVGIMRQKTRSFEEALKSCNNLTSIRTLGEKNPDLESEVLDALAPMKALLQGIFIRLQLKDHKFETFEAASKLEMDELWKHILAVDDTVTPETTTKAGIQNKEKFQDFLQRHCKVRHYMFSVKKCNSTSCICKPPRLPRPIFDSLHHLPDPVPDSDHYKDFEHVYGKGETTEEHRPSLKEAEKKGSGIPFTPTAQFAKNVSLVIQCHECERWRLIYSKNALNFREKAELGGILEQIQYSCGSGLQEIEHDDHSVLRKLFTRMNLTCSSPMEIPYYSSNEHEPLCFHCGCEDIVKDDMMEDKYPICHQCIDEKKPLISKRKRASVPQSSSTKKQKPS